MSTPAPLATVLFSGGLDSTVALAHYTETGYRVLAITVDYGQRHAREIHHATLVAVHYGAEHLVVDLRGVGPLLTGSALTDPAVPVPDGHYAETTMRATVVPNRNAILASVAAGVAVARGAGLLALAVHAGDRHVYPDCRPQFTAALDHLVAVGNEGFAAPRVVAPFQRWTKGSVVRYGTELGAPLHLTWSCYKGGPTHCGTCGTCVERREAFARANVEDPTSYATPAMRHADGPAQPQVATYGP